MKRMYKTFTLVGSGIALSTALMFACKNQSSDNSLNGYSTDELFAEQCGEIACKDIKPNYKLMIDKVDPGKSESDQHNVVRIGIFISHDEDAKDKPAGYSGDDLAEKFGGKLPEFDQETIGKSCEVSEDNDLGVRSALKMFSYLTGHCAPSLAQLVAIPELREHQAEELASEEATRSHQSEAQRKWFLKNPSWKSSVEGTRTTLRVWGRGPVLALGEVGITEAVRKGAEDQPGPRLEAHNYVFDIVVDNAGAELGGLFAEHLTRKDTAMSFLWGHFYPADADAAAEEILDQSGGQSVRNYFGRRTSEIYGPMLRKIKSSIASTKKPYLLGFFVGCFSEQLEEALISTVNEGHAETKFDWIGQRGRHNYLEFHSTLHRVLAAMHRNATYAHLDKNQDGGILSAFKFGGKGLESRWSTEVMRNFFDEQVPNAVIPVLRSNRYANISEATAANSGFTYDESGSVRAVD